MEIFGRKYKIKSIISALIVLYFIVFLLYLPSIISATKVSYDVEQKGESYISKTPYQPVQKNDVAGRIFTKLFRDSYSQKSYDLAADLMKEGYYDARPWEQDSDTEYRQKMLEEEPIYGDKSENWDNIIDIEVKDGVEDDDIEYVRACIQTMPQAFVGKMAEDGWKVILSADNNLTSPYDDKHENMETIGQTNYEEKTIFLVSGELYGTVYHEFGHVLAYYAKDELDKAGLLDFNNEELSGLCNHMAFGSLYIYLNPDEQLAESFYDYLYYPRELKKQAPVLYGIYNQKSKSPADNYGASAP